MSLRGAMGGGTVDRIFLAYSELCSPALRSASSTLSLLSAAIYGGHTTMDEDRRNTLGIAYILCVADPTAAS